jgi:hypothetical protein
MKEDTAKLYIVGKKKNKWHKNTLVVKVKNGCVYQIFEVKGQTTVSFNNLAVSSFITLNPSNYVSGCKTSNVGYNVAQ